LRFFVAWALVTYCSGEQAGEMILLAHCKGRRPERVVRSNIS
jgi:hypothetical protein